jgi:hypothetical protein
MSPLLFPFFLHHVSMSGKNGEPSQALLHFFEFSFIFFFLHLWRRKHSIARKVDMGNQGFYLMSEVRK